MAQKNIKCAILFADVAGSTRLYEDVGDDKARAMISHAIESMTQSTTAMRGRVIKTIGDEIMCVFVDADSAVKAGYDMQETISNDYTHGRTLAIRVGAHFGPAILESDGDIFGDAVNIAARMVGIAKAGQFIITEDTVNRLDEDLKADTREFDRAPVKGKKEPMIIYEVMWAQEDVTRMAAPIQLSPQSAKPMQMKLRWRDQQIDLTESNSVTVIGRGDQADFIVDDKLASRLHVRVEVRRGKFVLIDQSTNGTFVRTNDGKEAYLRREELPLLGAGTFSLGQPVSSETAELIYYLVE
ncbi:MAG: adenylate/guanylate cyclase domain-containing protein [Gammaproteobacteria bacterium]|nr:MAG: adenylate/guanylate cyclase domain-containing protein [Gammaproteobacteria bacterium]